MTSPLNPALPTPPAAQVAALRVAELEAENLRLKSQIEWFKRQLFGRKSEKQRVLNPD